MTPSRLSHQTAPGSPGAETRPRRVYLIHQPSIAKRGPQPDLNKLAGHGELHMLIRAGEHVTRDPRRALRLITERLDGFDPLEDALVWLGGDTLAAVLVGVALAELGHEDVRWLWYDRPPLPGGGRDDAAGVYRPITVPLFTTDLTHDDPEDFHG